MGSKIVVLDNSTGEVHVLPVDDNTFDVNIDIQELYDSFNEALGLNLKDSQCSWMHVEKLTIQIH